MLPGSLSLESPSQPLEGKVGEGLTCLFICMAQGRMQAGHTAGEHLDQLFPGYTVGEYLGLSPLSIAGLSSG